MPIIKKKGTATLLFDRAFKMGLSPSWVTDNNVFVVNTQAGERYITNSVGGLNSHTSAGLARNKFVTRRILDRFGLPNIPYARPSTLEEAKSFLKLHKTIVVKPVRGMGATDIHIVRRSHQLKNMNVKKYIFEKYVSGKEMRYLVLDGSIIGVHESRYGDSVDAHRYLERISIANEDWDNALASMSIQISGILGLAFSAIDFLITEDGEAFVLEVNSSPGLKWFHAPSEGPVVDVAKLFLESFIDSQSTNKLSHPQKLAI